LGRGSPGARVPLAAAAAVAAAVAAAAAPLAARAMSSSLTWMNYIYIYLKDNVF
jgi:hypothetical protein